MLKKRMGALLALLGFVVVLAAGAYGGRVWQRTRTILTRNERLAGLALEAMPEEIREDWPEEDAFVGEAVTPGLSGGDALPVNREGEEEEEEKNELVKASDLLPDFRTLDLEGERVIGLLEVPSRSLSLVLTGSSAGSEDLVSLTDDLPDPSIPFTVTGPRALLGSLSSAGIGDRVFFTDLEGRRYSYAIEGIVISDAGTEPFVSEETGRGRAMEALILTYQAVGRQRVLISCGRIRDGAAETD